MLQYQVINELKNNHMSILYRDIKYIYEHK